VAGLIKIARQESGLAAILRDLTGKFSSCDRYFIHHQRRMKKLMKSSAKKLF
jgi:hypothetical protein